MDFNQALVGLLDTNGGKATFQEVTDLLPASQKHRVMMYLNNARNAGLCAYNVKRVEGESVIQIFKPVSELESVSGETEGQG